MTITKILFDFDGTLVDTQKLHARAEALLMEQYFDIQLKPDDITLRYAGRPTVLMFQELTQCSIETAKMMEHKKWDLLFKWHTEADPLCDVRFLFETLCNANIAFAIGTASTSKWAMSLLRHHGMDSFFSKETVVCGDMVLRGKPAPDIWIAAAGNTSPENCLVVEDGVAGVDAAETAGMSACLILPNRHKYAATINNSIDVLKVVGCS